jgi:hypothetical protein
MGCAARVGTEANVKRRAARPDQQESWVDFNTEPVTLKMQLVLLSSTSNLCGLLCQDLHKVSS